jgi:hypothetical protein
MLIPSASTAQDQIRFLRVFYTTSMHTTETVDVHPEAVDSGEFALKMHCKQFVPRSSGLSARLDFEGLLSSKNRLESWVRRNGK